MLVNGPSSLSTKDLPGVVGHEVLAAMKDDPELRSIPVVVVSGSHAESDLARAYDQQVAAYIVRLAVALRNRKASNPDRHPAGAGLRLSPIGWRALPPVNGRKV